MLNITQLHSHNRETFYRESRTLVEWVMGRCCMKSVRWKRSRDLCNLVFLLNAVYIWIIISLGASLRMCCLFSFQMRKGGIKKEG